MMITILTLTILATSGAMTPEQEHWLGNAIAVGAAVAAGAAGISYLITRGKAQKVDIESQPEQRHAVRLATWEELQQLRVEFVEMRGEYRLRSQHIEDKMEHVRTDILEAGEQRAVQIHNRVNTLAEKVGELIGQLKKGGRA